MNILYVHGFGSQFDPVGGKVEALSRLGTVHGIDVDYCDPADTTLTVVGAAVISLNIDLIVGTSMGGWTASQIGAMYGIPFVAINPALYPSESLRKYLGKGVDYYDRPYEMTEEVVNTYVDFALDGAGLILLDKGDELIDSNSTLDALDSFYSVNMFEGGNHRFAHIEESIPLIEQFVDRAELVYGLTND